MKLFHNTHDKFSRDYIDLYGDGITTIGWYEDGQATAAEWLSVPTNPSVSRFPGVLVETNDEMSKAQANFPWSFTFQRDASGSFMNTEIVPFFIYPESIDWNLNQLK